MTSPAQGEGHRVMFSSWSSTLYWSTVNRLMHEEHLATSGSCDESGRNGLSSGALRPGGGPRFMRVLRQSGVQVLPATHPVGAQTATLLTLSPGRTVAHVAHPTTDLGVAMATATTPTSVGALLEPEGVPHPVRELAHPPQRSTPPPDSQADLTTLHALPVGTGAASFSLLHGNTFPVASPSSGLGREGVHVGSGSHR